LSLKEPIGSPYYTAPEIISKSENGEKVDIWSIGVVAHFLLSGKPPFCDGSNNMKKDDIFKCILENTLDLKGPEFDKLSDNAKDFLAKCLEKD